MGIQRGKIGFVLLVLLVGAFLGGGTTKADVNDANNWGHLTFEPKITNSKTNNTLTVVKDDEYYPGASDGIDAHDIHGVTYLPNRAWINSDVNNTDLWEDYRANSSRTPIRIKVGYKGSVIEGSEPNLSLEFSWLYEGTFGTMPLILTQEDANGINDPNSFRGSVRAVIANGDANVGRIDFGKIPAGTYDPNTPFLHLRLDFDKPLGDLDNDYVVNFKDYAILAERWGEEERSIADISGANDVPDNVVDYYDLKRFTVDYLK